MDDLSEETKLLSGEHEKTDYGNGWTVENGHALTHSQRGMDSGQGDICPESVLTKSYTWEKMLLDDIDFDGNESRPPGRIKRVFSWCSCKVSGKTKDNLRIFKIAVMFAIMFVCSVFFTLKDEVEKVPEIFPLSSDLPYFTNISELGKNTFINVRFTGPLLDVADVNTTENVSMSLLVRNPSACDRLTSLMGSVVYTLNREHPFSESNYWFPVEGRFDVESCSDDAEFLLQYETNVDDVITLTSTYTLTPPSSNEEVVWAAIVLVGVYVLIGFELVHRTTAAMLGSFAVLAILTSYNQRPTLEVVMEWLDYDTLALLWGMMTIVAIFSETGFFDYCALVSYKLAKGRIWTLVTILCFFSGIVSAFLDNVTTILLLTPVTISLCEVLEIDPRYVLIAEVVFSNIGGTATAIGDPPNVIIVSNSEIQDAGIGFADFTLHLSLGIIFCMVIGYFVLRLLYRGINLHSQDTEVRELKHEIEVWRQAATRIMVASKEESTVKALLLQKVYQLETQLRNRIYQSRQSAGRTRNWQEKLAELEVRYCITDKVLLAKCSFVLIAVIILFFSHSLVVGIYLNLGWIAVIGAVALLLLADVHDIENVMHRVEWATLLFFAALFVLMEGLTELGLIKYIGDLVADLIEDVPEESRLTVALILILWVSALASSFIDNIPFTTAMIPIVLDLGEREELGLPLKPMVWALAFGACLGGNGTLIGASANVVCAGIADQHGYGFSFVDFLKVGFPMMLSTTFVAMIYLLVCHSWLGWND